MRTSNAGFDFHRADVSELRQPDTRLRQHARQNERCVLRIDLNRTLRHQPCRCFRSDSRSQAIRLHAHSDCLATHSAARRLPILRNAFSATASLAPAPCPGQLALSAVNVPGDGVFAQETPERRAQQEHAWQTMQASASSKRFAWTCVRAGLVPLARVVRTLKSSGAMCLLRSSDQCKLAAFELLSADTIIRSPDTLRGTALQRLSVSGSRSSASLTLTLVNAKSLLTRVMRAPSKVTQLRRAPCALWTLAGTSNVCASAARSA